jgi:hypothetical protein
MVNVQGCAARHVCVRHSTNTHARGRVQLVISEYARISPTVLQLQNVGPQSGAKIDLFLKTILIY